MTARVAVAVIGPGDTDDTELLAAATDVGRGLAMAGYVVVTGGLGGVMAAASAGAAAAGGTVVGILPGADAAAANAWVDVVVPTGMGELRNALVVRAAGAVVAVGGSWGTLSEIALARRIDRPVVALGGWRVDGPAPDDGPVVVDSPAAAVRAVAALLAAGPP